MSLLERLLNVEWGAAVWQKLMPELAIIIGETVIVLTPSHSPTKCRGLCSRIAVSPTATSGPGHLGCRPY